MLQLDNLGEHCCSARATMQGFVSMLQVLPGRTVAQVAG